MRFRPPLKTKWFYPFVLCGFFALAYGVIRLGVMKHIVHGVPVSGAPVYFLGLLTFGAWVCIMISWSVWTARVDVDDAGVRWEHGKMRGFRRWEEISSLALHGISIALVERASGNRIPLPFTSRKL